MMSIVRLSGVALACSSCKTWESQLFFKSAQGLKMSLDMGLVCSWTNDSRCFGIITKGFASRTGRGPVWFMQFWS